MSIYLRSNITGSGILVADWNNSISAVFSVDSITAGTVNTGDTVTIQLSNASASGKTLNVNGVPITPTAQDSSSISFLAMDLFTFASGIYRFDTNIPITVVDGAESDSINLQISPDTGYTQFAVPDPIAGVWASSEFTTAIDPQVLAIGDYIWCTNPADSDAPNGSFPESSSIDYRIMDMSDGTPAWGDEGTITITAVSGDVTAPVLSSPTATVNGAYAATGTVSTDESGGTLYVVVSTNSTETSATIKASINNQPVVSTGTQNISASGLSPETTYYIHYVQVDSAGNTSNVVSSTSFTTEAATSGGFDSWDEWMESLDAGTFTTKLRSFLQGKGYSGSTTTMLYEYLKTVSSKASHQERKKDWEEGGWN